METHSFLRNIPKIYYNKSGAFFKPNIRSHRYFTYFRHIFKETLNVVFGMQKGYKDE